MHSFIYTVAACDSINASLQRSCLDYSVYYNATIPLKMHSEVVFQWFLPCDNVVGSWNHYTINQPLRKEKIKPRLCLRWCLKSGKWKCSDMVSSITRSAFVVLNLSRIFCQSLAICCIIDFIEPTPSVIFFSSYILSQFVDPYIFLSWKLHNYIYTNRLYHTPTQYMSVKNREICLNCPI